LDFLTVFDRRKCGKQQPTRWHFRVKKAARKNLPQRFATSDYPTAKKPLQNLISGCFLAAANARFSCNILLILITFHRL
jgi:hypothetical protein